MLKEIKIKGTLFRRALKELSFNKTNADEIRKYLFKNLDF